MAALSDPPFLCTACPRLYAFLQDARAHEPDWYNGPVPSFGTVASELLIVGLAPGLKGANRTGRPFTGDYAGDLLYQTLLTYGFAAGVYGARPDDGLVLRNCRITNAVRCVPPQNKPTGAEIATCRHFLAATISEMPNLRAIVALGRVAHDTLLTTLECRRADFPFAHGAQHDTPHVRVFDSFHCSRYNTNTGRLTEPMFHAVFAAVRAYLQPGR